MTATEKAKQALQKKSERKVLSPEKQKYNRISDMLKSMREQIKQAIPKHITPDRISRIALTNIRMNSKLLECSELSLLGAVLQSAQLGLEPSNQTGKAYLIPFNNKGKMEVQFQIGYKGLIELFYRSEQSLNIDAHEVYENDEFEFEYGLDSKLKHKPTLMDRGDVIAYYAVARMKNGAYGFVVMSRKDIEIHAAKYSQAYKKGWMSSWKTNFDEMAKKTVIKKLTKYLPLSTEIQRAIAQDETIKEFKKETPIEETKDITDWEVVIEENEKSTKAEPENKQKTENHRKEKPKNEPEPPKEEKLPF